MNKEQTSRELSKENYLLIESKVFEKLSYEIVYNPYADRTIIFYNILDKEKELHLVDMLTWYWGETYGFEAISIEELDELIWEKEFILAQFLARKEEA